VERAFAAGINILLSVIIDIFRKQSLKMCREAAPKIKSWSDFIFV